MWVYTSTTQSVLVFILKTKVRTCTFIHTRLQPGRFPICSLAPQHVRQRFPLKTWTCTCHEGPDQCGSTVCLALSLHKHFLLMVTHTHTHTHTCTHTHGDAHKHTHTHTHTHTYTHGHTHEHSQCTVVWWMKQEQKTTNRNSSKHNKNRIKFSIDLPFSPTREKNCSWIRRKKHSAVLFSSDPAVSSSVFVREKQENLIRNDPDKSEFSIEEEDFVTFKKKIKKWRISCKNYPFCSLSFHLVLCLWGLCTLRRGIQNSMEAILAFHPAWPTEWLHCWLAKWCENWRIRTGPIEPHQVPTGHARGHGLVRTQSQSNGWQVFDGLGKGMYLILTPVAKQMKTAFSHGPTVWKSPIVKPATFRSESAALTTAPRDHTQRKI